MTIMLRKKPSKLEQIKRAKSLMMLWGFDSSQSLNIIQKLDERLLSDSRKRIIEENQENKEENISLEEIELISDCWKKYSKTEEDIKFKLEYAVSLTVALELGEDTNLEFDYLNNKVVVTNERLGLSKVL